MSDQIPQTPVQPAKRSLMQRVSIVWVVPMIALAIALGIAWHSYQNRGAVIEISFVKASGIAAEQTQLRFREVSVGVVEKVSFSDDLTHVVAHVRLDKSVEPFVDSDAVFWVVQPEVSARGVSGLQTVLSGVYIEGSWDNVPGGLHRDFVGLEQPPVARPDEKGKRITLSSSTGKGLNEGVPILYKGIEVGQVGRPTLSPDGVTITADAFIAAPHDELLTTRSRFWNVSGVSFNIGTGGVSLDVESVASLITGGISFETVVSGGGPAQDGQTFAVFGNQDEARDSLFDGQGPDGGTIEISMVFEQNVTGLNVGAPVLFEGLQIGEVVGLTGRVDQQQFGDENVRLVVVLSIELGKLKAAPHADTREEEEAAILDFLAQAAADGWRARLVQGSILTGALKIEIVQLPDSPPAEFQRDATPYPIFPSVEADLQGVTASAEGLIQRVQDLPIEDLMNSAKTFLDNAAELVASDDIKKIPGDVRGAVEDLRSVLTNPEFQALPDKISGVAEEVRDVIAELQERDGVGKLLAAIDNAGQAAAEVGTAVEGVPELVERIGAVAEKAAALDLEGLLTQAEGLVADAGDILGTDAARELPKRLVEAVDAVDGAVRQATTMLGDLNEAGAATMLSDAIAKVNTAAADIGTAVEGLPALIDEARAVAAKAEALNLEQLVDEVSGLVESADALIGTDSARALPASLNGALDEVRDALAELREGGTVENVNAALDSAERAADSIAQASADLPGLVQRTEAVLREAELALAGLSDSGSLNRDARAALREVSRAAESVRSLARMLERKPNALVTGK